MASGFLTVRNCTFMVSALATLSQLSAVAMLLDNESNRTVLMWPVARQRCSLALPDTSLCCVCVLLVCP